MQLQLIKLLVMTMAVIALLMPTSTAHAAQDAHDVRNQWLTAAPNNMMDTGYVRRRIWLAAGMYGFYTHVRPNAIGGQCNNRTGHIPAGWYTWKDRFIPKNGHYYFHDSVLIPDNSAVDPIWITCNKIRLPSSGWYTWGSVLDPHF